MRKTLFLAPVLTLLLTVGGAPLAFGETPFVTMDVKVEVAHPPDPAVPGDPIISASSVEIRFEPDGVINPPDQEVTLEFHPPDPTHPPDPSNPRVNRWQLLFPATCFVAQPGGRFLVEDFLTCGASVTLFFDDAFTTILDLIKCDGGRRLQGRRLIRRCSG